MNGHNKWDIAQGTREQTYPSLITSQPSRKITLSSGLRFRRADHLWYVYNNIHAKWMASIDRPDCYIATDHDKCAALLREEQ